MAKSANIKFFCTISAVMIVFLALRIFQLVYSIVTSSESTVIIAGRSLTIISCAILAYLTIKKNLFAAWAMLCLLIISGISIFLFGIFAIPVKQYVFKIVSIILAAYFLYGGIILFRAIKKGEMKDINLSLMKKT
jgi:hypothetical protein